mmetsp:Transcript_80/g.283  ORF Transcript_80/g.283 Transcript_80/m.283 type:complete len:453 (-) Transcript_80:706-2064(-)
MGGSDGSRGVSAPLINGQPGFTPGTSPGTSVDTSRTGGSVSAFETTAAAGHALNGNMQNGADGDRREVSASYSKRPGHNGEERAALGTERREPVLDVDLLDGDGKPTEFIFDSPFLDLDSPMTAYEWFKAIVMAPVAIIRAIAGLAALLLGWAVCSLVLIGTSPKVPLPGWKSAVTRRVVKVAGRVIILFGASKPVTVKGWKHFREGQEAHCPIIFNHVSYLDALVLATYFAPCGVAKADVATLPIVGTITRSLQFLFVARSGTTDTTNRYTIVGDMRAEVAKREVDPAFPSFIIAPEGTTKPKHCLLRFSVGGFAPGVPVQPVLINYSRNKHFNPGWGLPKSTPWLMWRLVTQFVNHIDLTILPVYKPSEAEKADPRLYADNVRALMSRELKAPMVNVGTREEFVLKRSGVVVDNSGCNVLMKTRSMDKPRHMATIGELVDARRRATAPLV